MLGTAVEALPACLDADGEILSVHFFAACRLVLPVIGEDWHRGQRASERPLPR